MVTATQPQDLSIWGRLLDSADNAVTGFFGYKSGTFQYAPQGYPVGGYMPPAGGQPDLWYPPRAQPLAGEAEPGWLMPAVIAGGLVVLVLVMRK